MNRNKFENFISICVQCCIQGKAELLVSTNSDQLYQNVTDIFFFKFFVGFEFRFLSNNGILLNLKNFWPSTFKLFQGITRLGFLEAY